MLETTVDEVDEAFKAAKNLNAALKHFLKKEQGLNDSGMRFAKDFRAAVAPGRPVLVRSFIERNLKERELYFLRIAYYAHPEFLNLFVDQIVNAYGDTFNATYEKSEDSIEVKDRAAFSKIVKEVSEKMDLALKEAGLPASNFMKNTILLCVFEPNVLEEVLNTLKK